MLSYINYDSSEHYGLVTLEIKRRIGFTMNIIPSISKDLLTLTLTKTSESFQ